MITLMIIKHLSANIGSTDHVYFSSIGSQVSESEPPPNSYSPFSTLHQFPTPAYSCHAPLYYFVCSAHIIVTTTATTINLKTGNVEATDSLKEIEHIYIYIRIYL